mgnify:CR=1 FL=1
MSAGHRAEAFAGARALLDAAAVVHCEQNSPNRARPLLQMLADIVLAATFPAEPFEHLLFAHGEPRLGDGREALREFASG